MAGSISMNMGSIPCSLPESPQIMEGEDECLLWGRACQSWTLTTFSLSFPLLYSPVMWASKSCVINLTRPIRAVEASTRIRKPFIPLPWGGLSTARQDTLPLAQVLGGEFSSVAPSAWMHLRYWRVLQEHFSLQDILIRIDGVQSFCWRLVCFAKIQEKERPFVWAFLFVYLHCYYNHCLRVRQRRKP